jgi:hypothetical protein
MPGTKYRTPEPPVEAAGVTVAGFVLSNCDPESQYEEVSTLTTPVITEGNWKSGTVRLVSTVPFVYTLAITRGNVPR